MALKSGRVGIHPSQVDPITGMLINVPSGDISFEDLSDAQISDPEAGQTLQYNGTGWENVFASISPTTLATLQDVQITEPEDGEYLTYDSANSKWINSGSAPTPDVPEGSTVTPTDDIQKWLNCAGIFDKTSYTTLADVLADSTTLLALMSDNNAVDYLVRSTTWASGITANSTAMTDIGANNYCANKLLSNSTWLNAICNSTYFESVLNVKVPTMTSNTAPSGAASGSSMLNNNPSIYDYYHVFDGNENTQWIPNDTDGWIQYEFPSAITVRKLYIYNISTSNRPFTAVFKGSNDATAWTELKTDITMLAGDRKYITINNSTSYKYYRLYTSGTNSGMGGFITEMQFYGRQDI